MIDQFTRAKMFHRRLWALLWLVTVLVSFHPVISAGSLTPAIPHNVGDEEFLAAIYQELIPPAGAQTGYGVLLDLANLPVFIDWYYGISLDAEGERVFHDALIELVAPCCDDNTMVRCCCEKGERACNLVRSGKGLASYLIHDMEYDVEQVREAVLQWLRFARPDYYAARELEERGIDTRRYDLTTLGSCYRQMCVIPISQGGCGGMDELMEPAIQGDRD